MSRADPPARETAPSDWDPKKAPMVYRWLLSLYPRWFRHEFEPELLGHLMSQRQEPRYQVRMLGAGRFWWHAGADALVTATKLYLGRARERGSELTLGWHKERGGPRDGQSDQEPEHGGVGMMVDSVLRDIRHAFRGLTKNPGYAAVFIVTLGLGIGANTAMFSAVNGVLLRPLPHDDGDRLVYFRHTASRANIANALFSVPEIEEYRQGSPSLEAVAEFSALNFNMLGYETPRRVRAGIVTGNYFDVMGLRATLGRTIGQGDDGSTVPAVVVISDRYWQNVFGADPSIVGKTVEINGRTATFVGVAEPAPPYPERTDIYVNMAASPHHLDASMSHDRIHRMTEVFAKLAPGATVETVRGEVSRVTSRIHEEYPEAYDAGSGFEVTVTPLKTQLTARARPIFFLLLGTAFLVLVIACANLANLTLTRVLRRDQELAVRVSLGASKGALRRQLLIESLVLAAAGAGVGLLMASVSLDLLVNFAERFTARASEIALDASVFGFALLAAVAASALFTVLPPLPNGESGAVLTRSGARSTGGSKARRAQRSLVVAQIGTSFVLLIGAGLLLRTMSHLSKVDPGFDTTQILSMDIPVDFDGSPESDVESKYLTILRGVRALPGVEGASLTSSIPLAGGNQFSGLTEMAVEGHEPVPGAPVPRAELRVVSEGYFQTMGIELLSGREFTTTDGDEGQHVVIVNESMARAYFGDRDPVGQRIAWTDEVLKFIGLGDDWRTVVGVVADTRDAGLDADVGHVIYNPYGQVTPFYTGSLVVRAKGDPGAVVPAVRDVILGFDSNQPITNVATIADLGDESVAPRRLNAILLVTFALLALIIAAVGIGGVLAFSVGSRTKEFGVRSALGAARHQVWSGVLAEGAVLAGIGVAIGGIAAIVLARFISGLLVGVPALDPLTFVVVGLLLGAVAVGAAWLPAWRAAEVSPMEALRSE